MTKDDAKKAILDRVAKAGIEGIDLDDVIEELAEEAEQAWHDGHPQDDESEDDDEQELEDPPDPRGDIIAAAEELQSEGRTEEFDCSGVRLSYGEFADRILTALDALPSITMLGDTSRRDTIIQILKGDT